jgi:hypothetical protein
VKALFAEIRSVDYQSVARRIDSDPPLVHNIGSVAYLTVYNSYQLGIARPSLTTGLNDTQALLARYNGTGEAAQQYGSELIGLFNVLENYNLLSRNK